MPAIAIANNDVVQIVWAYTQKIDGCLGFALYRKEAPGTGTDGWQPLPSWVGFEGQNNPNWQPHPTLEWPVQKFEWRDLTATRGKTYVYKVVPVSGDPAKGGPLHPMDDKALETCAVTLTPDRGPFATYFNRGILSTQFLAHALPPGPSGQPNYRSLQDHITTPDDPLRKALAGQILEGLERLLDRAEKEGGTCFAALYELNDPELLNRLLNAKYLTLILSNTAPEDKTNQDARRRLHDAGLAVLDRFVPDGHIGHNKFVVYVDKEGTPTAVLLGSTNWTATGICAQSNNALVVENTVLAKAYLDYWNRLKTDTDAGAKQATALRTANSRPGAAAVAVDGGQATVWFSPNTPHARNADPNEQTPPDLAQVFELMREAKQAILFLEFQPGSPSIIDCAAQCQNANSELFVRGAVTDPKAENDFAVTLTHRRPGDEIKVVAANAIDANAAYWQKELLKSGPMAHAIIHDKIVVIDPMSRDCVVVTGSHNHGYRASYNNDENLLIVKGHQALAQAYAVHVMDVYDHYRFRAFMDANDTKGFSGLKRDDSWQDRYFDLNDPASGDRDVWFPR